VIATTYIFYTLTDKLQILSLHTLWQLTAESWRTMTLLVNMEDVAALGGYIMVRVTCT